MTGHEQLLALRRRGMAPSSVWVTDTDLPMCWQIARDWHIHGDYPAIVLRADDTPEAMDFRCLVGLQVHARSDRSEERGARLFDSIKAANPALVVAVLNGEVCAHWRA